ncbi:MAG: DUF6017 domain-containing protein [Candidatus Ornithomonoglobus sp.]
MSSVFRIEKNKNYTVMSNHHLRNKNLTLKSKGLLSLMLSLPEEWDYTLKGLSCICKEGIDAIRASVQELEQYGYVERHRIRNGKGWLTGTEYIIHEYPVIYPTPPQPTLDKPTQGNPILENPTQINKDKTITEELNKDLIKYQSINQGDTTTDSISTDNRWIDRYNQNEMLIKNNIEYTTLLHSYDRSIVDEIVAVMTEVLTVDTAYYTIEKKQYPTELVRKRFLEIGFAKMDAFLIEFSRRTEKIHNTKAYLITSLFNIPATAETNLANMVMNDMYSRSD